MKNSGNHLSLRKFCVLMLMLVSYTDTFVLAAPKGGRVVSGTATIQQDGNLTVITAGNRSVINYGSFNIAAGETVRFVQPGANASVLNRVVGSASPTEIFGALQGNGRVFIVNPYGIYFRNGSVINVGSLYAGAGNLSDADFAKGKIKFTDLAGDVRNDGIIAADNRIALMGVNVVNTGSLNAAHGMAMMVSGQDVYVGEKNGNIFVQANGKPQVAATATGAAPASSGSIRNSGTVAAPRVLLGGGDLYSTAISNSGLLTGGNVTINAGRNGTATVGGKIDATSSAPGAVAGKGGNIQVLGGTVALKGATLDASGTAGGGSIRVGGDFQGKGDLAHAQTTTVDSTTSLRADDTGQTGDGGSVVLWSDALTSYQGQTSVRGGSTSGDGGQVEVSSHGDLGFAGKVDAAAPGGKTGSLLLDPTNITISVDNAATNVPANGTVSGGNGNVNISAASLEALDGNININLVATKDIFIDSLNVPNTVATPNGVGTVFRLTLQQGTGTVTFQAGTGGSGSFVMSDAITAGLVDTGPQTILAPGRAVTILASGPSSGGINNGNANAIDVGNINTRSNGANGRGGDINLLISTPQAASAPVVFNALTTTATGTGGVGGAVTVGGATTAFPTRIAAGTINTAATTTPGTIKLQTTPAGTVTFAAAPTFTGDTTIITNGIAITGGGQLDGGGHDLTLTLGSPLMLSSVVSSTSATTGVRNFLTNGAGGTVIDVANFTTTGSQTYNTDTTLNVNSTLTAQNNGGVTIGGGLDSSATGGVTNARTLMINTGGLTQINAPIGRLSALGAFSTDATGGTNDFTVFNVTGGLTAVTTVNNGTAPGTQTYGDGVRLTADTKLASTVTAAAPAVGGTIAFGKTVNSVAGQAYGLSITNTGTTTFGGEVGTTSALLNLSTGAGTTNVNGGAVTTSGAGGQTYNGALVLGRTVITPGTPVLTTLTANNGPILFTGTVNGNAAGTQALSASGNGVTFSAPVGGNAALDSLTTLGATSLNGGAVTTTGAAGQVYDALTLNPTGGSTVLNAGSGLIRFNSTVAVTTANTQALTLTTTGTQTFSGPVGSSTIPLLSLSTGSGSIALNGGAVTTSGAQNYNGLVTLGLPGGTTTAPASTVLTATGNADITFASTVNVASTGAAGTQSLTVNTPGNEVFFGQIGNTNPLAALVTDAGGSLGGNTLLNAQGTDAAPSVVTNGAQVFFDPVVLGANTVLKGTSLFLGNGLDGTGTGTTHYNLTLTFASNVLLNGGTADGQAAGRTLGAYNNLGSFVVNGAGTATLDGDFETYGSQIYASPVSIDGNRAVRSDNNAAISFAKVDSLSASSYDGLSVFTTGATTFNGQVGGTNPLGGLTTDAGGTTTFGYTGAGNAVRTVNSGAGALGAITINDNVTLTANTTLASGFVAPATVGGDIRFTGSVDGPGSLTLNTTGATGLTGSVGAGVRLGSLTIAANGAGTTLGTGGVINTTGIQSYGSPLTLGANTILSTTNPDANAGAITFGSTVGGAGFNLTTTTLGGSTVFGAASGSVATALLNILTTSAQGTTFFNDAAFTTAGTQNYQGAVLVQSATRALSLVSNAGNILFGGPLSSTAALSTDLSITTKAAGSNVRFAGAVGGTATSPSAAALNSLSVSSPTINIDGGLVNTASSNPRGLVNTDGLQTYTGAVVLGANTTFVGTNVTASGGVDGQNLYDLTLTLSGQVTVPLGGFNNIVNFTSNGTGGTKIAGNFTTQGFQHYDNNTILGADSTLTAGAGGFEFGVSGAGNTLTSPDTPYSLTLTTTGPVAFNGVVGGGNAPLRALTVTNGAGTISLNGSGVTTTAGQSYGGPVSLGAPGGTVTLTSNNGGEIDFLKSVDGTTANTQTLVTNTSNSVVYSGAVGGSRALAGLRANGTGTTTINGPGITTFGGGQIYQGPVSLDGAATVALTDGSNGALNFGSTLDNFVGSSASTTLSTGGVVTFGGAVGGLGRLGNLQVLGGAINVNGGSILSTGFQTYVGPVSLGNGALFSASGTSDINFTGTINGTSQGGQSLTVQTPGNEVFGGSLGNAFALASLQIDALGSGGGQTRFNMPAGSVAGVRVTGDVSVYDTVVFNSLGSTLTTPTVLTLSGNQLYNQGGSATQNTALVGGGSLSTGGNLDFGGHDLSVRFGGLVTVPGAFTNVGNFISDGAGGTAINGTFGTGGSQFYGNVVTLSGTPTLNAAGLITFNSTVDGNAPLSLTVTGTGSQATFNGLVGNGTALASLTTNTNGGTVFNGNAAAATLGNGAVNLGADGLAITGPVIFNVSGSTLTSLDHPTVLSLGAQTYNGAATLQRDTALVAGGTNAITFGSTVDGTAALAVSTAGNEVFNGLIGSGTALTGLTTDAVGTAGGEAQFNGTIGAFQAGTRVDGAVTVNDAARFSYTDSSTAKPAVLTLNNGAQTYAGPVTLAAQTAFVGTSGTPTGSSFLDGGQITFNSTVASAAGRQNFYVLTGVGRTNLLGSIDANSTTIGGARTTFHNVGPVDVFSVQANPASPGGPQGPGSIGLGGNISTNGPQIYTDAVVLVAPTSLTAGTGGITFGSTVDSDDVSTPRSLLLNASGLNIFNGLVGNTAPLLSLTTDNQGAVGEGTQFNMNLAANPSAVAGVRVVNGVTINDPVFFNVQGSTVARPSILTGVNGGTGFQTYVSAATLRQNTVLADLGTGSIAFNGTVNGAFDLTVNTGGDEIFGGLVGNTAALASLQTDVGITPSGAARFNMNLAPAGTVAGVQVSGIVNVRDGVVFNAAGGGGLVPAVRTGGAQTYGGATGVLQDTILTSTGGGDLRFVTTVDGPAALTLNTQGSTRFGGIVGGVTPLASLTTDAAGNTSIEGGAITTAGTQLFNDPVTLTIGTILGSNGGDVHFASRVDGGVDLVVNAAGSAIFDAPVGDQIPLASLALNGVVGNRLNGTRVTTTGAQNYNTAVLLGADTALKSNQQGNITFKSLLDGAHALSITTGGVTSFDDRVGSQAALTSLFTDDQGSTILAGKSVQTTGSQTYGDAVTLTTDNGLTSTGSDVTFGGTLNGGFSLQVSTAGSAIFNGPIGVLTPLANLTTGRTLLNAGQVFVSGTQFYGGPTTLARNTTLSGVSAGVIRFGSTLDGSFILNLQDSSIREFDGAVGGTTPLASLQTDGPGVTRINGGRVSTTGSQTYQSPVVLGADTLVTTAGGQLLFGGSLDSDAATTPRSLSVSVPSSALFGVVGNTAPLAGLTVGGGGTALLGGDITTVRNGVTSGAQTYNEPVTLLSGVSLTSLSAGAAPTGGDLTFNSTLDGGASLALNTTGITAFNGVVGGAVPLAALATDAGGETRFNMTLGNSLAGVLVNGPVTVNDTARFAIVGASLAQPGVLTTGNGIQTYAGAVVLATDTFLTSASTTATGGVFTGGGAVAFTSSAGISAAGGNNLFVHGAVGTTRFASSVNVGSIDLGGADATFAGPVTLPGTLSVLPNDASPAGSITLAGGSLTTTGAQLYRVGVLLGADTVLTSLNTTGDGNITFAGTLDSDPTGAARALTLNTSGDEIFNGLVGSRSALASLTTDASGPVGGTTQFNVSLTGAARGTAGVRVIGDVLINDAVRFNVAGSSLANGLDTILSGGSQTYLGAGTLAQNTALESNAGGSLIFSALDGAFGLETRDTALHVFNGFVGGTTPLTALTTNGGTTQFNQTLTGSGAAAGLRIAGPVVVNGAALFNVVGSSATQPAVLTLGTGAQTYNGPTVLAQNTVLNAGGNLLFASTVDGAFALNLNTQGETRFNGVLGGATALASLATDAGGTTVLNGGQVTTSGAQNYGDAVSLGRDITLTSTTAGTIAFASTVDGFRDLNLSTDGIVRFDGAVGSIGPVNNLTVTGTGSTVLNGGTITTSNNQDFGNAVTLARDATLSSGAGVLRFRSMLDGTFNLTLRTPNSVVFNANVGGATALNSLTINPDGSAPNASIVFSLTGNPGGTLTVSTTGAQAYDDVVTLGSSVVLNTTPAGAVSAFGIIGGASHDLTVNTGTGTFGRIDAGNLRFTIGGLATFGGTISGVSLAVADGGASGRVQLNAGSVTTTGDQSFAEPVTLGVGTTLNTGGVITFARTLGGAQDLTVTGATTTVFGDTVNIGSLRVNAGDVNVNGGAITTAGNQAFANNVTLGRDTTLTANNAQIAFGSVSGKQHNLTLVSRRANLGTVGNVNVLDVRADALLNGANITTLRDQTYRGTVSLNRDVTLSNGSGLIDAQRALSGNAHALTVNGANATFAEIDRTGATTFNVSGTTTFNGEITDAASLAVANGRELRVNTDLIRTTGVQEYDQSVTAANDNLVFASSSGGRVAFGGTLDADTATTRNVTVSTTGETVFGNTVGNNSPLASLTVGNASLTSAPADGDTYHVTINGGSIHTTGGQVYNGLVSTNAPDGGTTTLSSDTSDLIFDRAVSGDTGGLKVTGNRIRMREDVRVNGDLTLDAAGSPLLLDGSNYVSTGNIVFNGNPNTATADLLRYSTIVLSNPGSVLVRGANFRMGDLQKLYAAGALDIEVGRGTATVGDIAARRTLRIGAANIQLLNRPGGTISSLGADTGLTFAADQSISFGSANVTYAHPGQNETANFVTTTGATTIVRRTGISIFRNPVLDQQFQERTTLDSRGLFAFAIPEQPVGGGSQTLDTAAAISGALPDQKPLDIPVDVTITASQMEELRKLGIHPRKAQKREYGYSSSKRALFAQLVDGEDADNYGRLQPIKGGVSRLVPSDYVVVVDRMSEREVQAILKAFEALYGKNKEKAPQIGASYQKAYDEYTAEKQTSDPAGFAPYLKEKTGKYPEVDAAGRGFDNLFGYIEHMGLTSVEVTKAESFIVSDLNVSGPTPDDMVKVINSQRKALPPAQKAPSTKVPPAPPMSSPGPAASPAPAASPVPMPRKADPLKTVRQNRKHSDGHPTAAGTGKTAPTPARTDLAGL